jgi:hypothetical protein
MKRREVRNTIPFLITHVLMPPPSIVISTGRVQLMHGKRFGHIFSNGAAA